MTDVSGVSSNKKPSWVDDGPDPAAKTADGKIGDKLQYKGTTKQGVDDAIWDRDVHDGVELLLGGTLGEFGFGPKSPFGPMSDPNPSWGDAGKKGGVFAVKVAKFVAAERTALAEGKKTKLQVAQDVAVFVAKTQVESGVSALGASPAYTVMKAIVSTIPKAIDDEKAAKQLYHDEEVKLLVAAHFEGQMPPGMYASIPNEMSINGQTYRTKGTSFDDARAGMEAAFKANPALAKDVDARFSHGKSAAIELGLADDKKFVAMMNPANKDPKAIAFRKAYSDPSNISFKLGVDALRYEAKHPKDPKSAELYEADLQKYAAEQEKQKLIPQQPVVVKP